MQLHLLQICCELVKNVAMAALKLKRLCSLYDTKLLFR